jgi:nuclear distribution protein NudE
LNEINSTTHKQISQLQEELAKLKAVKDEMQKYIRELEQKNDDLERTNRCAMFSLGEFESKLNDALERNAILESELDEKDELAETVQRLRDEARDLKQELAVRQQKNQKDSSQTPIQIRATRSSLSTTMDSTQLMDVDQSNTSMQALSIPYQSMDHQQHQQQLTHSLHFKNVQQPQLEQQKANKQQHPVTPSIRISALNYVSDALRKVTVSRLF